MTKKQRALEIIERLKKEYPDAGCTLDYDQAWKLLVSVRLAAQCTDARVNIVVEKLYEKFPDVDALAEAPVEEIEAIVKPCGLGHSKARDISACMKILRDKYDGKVPDDFDELLSLPGVGRKSANLHAGTDISGFAVTQATGLYNCLDLFHRSLCQGIHIRELLIQLFHYDIYPGIGTLSCQADTDKQFPCLIVIQSASGIRVFLFQTFYNF
jgi:endonuclease-3